MFALCPGNRLRLLHWLGMTVSGAAYDARSLPPLVERGVHRQDCAVFVSWSGALTRSVQTRRHFGGCRQGWSSCVARPVPSATMASRARPSGTSMDWHSGTNTLTAWAASIASSSSSQKIRRNRTLIVKAELSVRLSSPGQTIGLQGKLRIPA